MSTKSLWSLLGCVFLCHGAFCTTHPYQIYLIWPWSCSSVPYGRSASILFRAIQSHHSIPSCQWHSALCFSFQFDMSLYSGHESFSRYQCTSMLPFLTKANDRVIWVLCVWVCVCSKSSAVFTDCGSQSACLLNMAVHSCVVFGCNEGRFKTREQKRARTRGRTRLVERSLRRFHLLNHEK